MTWLWWCVWAVCAGLVIWAMGRLADALDDVDVGGQ